MSEPLSDPALEALWKRVLDAWDDDAVHQVFLDHCHETDRLLEAAVRYRGMGADRDRGVSAQKRLQSVALLALTKLEGSRTPDARARSEALKLLLMLLFVAGTVAMMFVMTR